MTSCICNEFYPRCIRSMPDCLCVCVCVCACVRVYVCVCVCGDWAFTRTHCVCVCTHALSCVFAWAIVIGPSRSLAQLCRHANWPLFLMCCSPICVDGDGNCMEEALPTQQNALVISPRASFMPRSLLDRLLLAVSWSFSNFLPFRRQHLDSGALGNLR